MAAGGGDVLRLLPRHVWSPNRAAQPCAGLARLDFLSSLSAPRQYRPREPEILDRTRTELRPGVADHGSRGAADGRRSIAFRRASGHEVAQAETLAAETFCQRRRCEQQPDNVELAALAVFGEDFEHLKQ